MTQYAFASAPFVVGNGSGTAPGLVAEETLCPVIADDWVNGEYKHLVLTASAKALTAQAGQFFNWLCPSPDDGDLWLRRPAEHLQGRSGAGPHRIPLQDRGPRHQRRGAARTGRQMKRLRAEHAIPGQVAVEQVMACGLGPCHVCVKTFEVKGKKILRRVCIEGPVFDLQEAVGW